MRGVIELAITKRDIDMAHSIAMTRHEKMSRRGLRRNIPTGKRTAFEKDRLGALGEVLYARHYGLKPDTAKLAGGDRCDFLHDGKMIDVKTAQYNDVSKLRLFVRAHSLDERKIYCLVWVASDMRSGQIRGFVTGKRVVARGKFGIDQFGHEYYTVNDGDLMRPLLRF